MPEKLVTSTWTLMSYTEDVPSYTQMGRDETEMPCIAPCTTSTSHRPVFSIFRYIRSLRKRKKKKKQKPKNPPNQTARKNHHNKHFLEDRFTSRSYILPFCIYTHLSYDNLNRTHSTKQVAACFQVGIRIHHPLQGSTLPEVIFSIFILPRPDVSQSLGIIFLKQLFNLSLTFYSFAKHNGRMQ